MKKKLSIFAVALIAAASCTENEMEDVAPSNNTVLTFEDSDYAAEANYLGYSSWSSLIDPMQYGGELLYALDDNWNGYSEYEWYDQNNTELKSEIITSWGSTAYWNGGIAVSNYYAEVAEGISYDNQLAVPSLDSATGGSGNNGSDNFGVVSSGGYIYFADGTSRVIDHLYVSATSYFMSVALYGNYSSEALGATDYFVVTATSVDDEGATLATTEFYLAQDGTILDGWNKWDLSSLGAVTKVIFTTDSSVTNDWGSSLPGYIAIDDIAVVM